MRLLTMTTNVETMTGDKVETTSHKVDDKVDDEVGDEVDDDEVDDDDDKTTTTRAMHKSS